MSLNNDAPATHPKLAEGTAPGTEYSPMPGDIVDIDPQAFLPSECIYGVRIGRVIRPSYKPGVAIVQLPGFEAAHQVEHGWMTLVRRG